MLGLLDSLELVGCVAGYSPMHLLVKCEPRGNLGAASDAAVSVKPFALPLGSLRLDPYLIRLAVLVRFAPLLPLLFVDLVADVAVLVLSPVQSWFVADSAPAEPSTSALDSVGSSSRFPA